jgi:hypothetical protein
MRRLIAISIMLVALPLLVPASEFDWLVREFSRESGTKPTHIPIFGLVRFVVGITQPAGTSEMKLAIFENTTLEPRHFGEITDEVAGATWKPIIRVRSRNGESSNIYADEGGKGLRLLITVLDHGEATFVQVRIKPEALIKFVDEHRNH